MARTKANKNRIKDSERIEARRKASKPPKLPRPPRKVLPKPYLRVPDDFELPNTENGEENPLPTASTLFRKHLFNQSIVSGWYVDSVLNLKSPSKM